MDVPHQHLPPFLGSPAIQPSLTGKVCYLPYMSRAPSWCGVILAAGESSRMGSDKALLPWPPVANRLPFSGETFLSAAIRSLNSATDQVVVVVGANNDSTRPGGVCGGRLAGAQPCAGGGSVQLFAGRVAGSAEPGPGRRDDHAGGSSSGGTRPCLAGLRAAFEASAADIWAVVPEYEGRHGHPFLAGREMIEILPESPGHCYRKRS